MATTPKPRSRAQILGEMLNTFLTKLALPSIKEGDPSLSILEAASQSDFRNTQETLKVLASRTLNGLTGTGLDAAGRDEKVTRIEQSPATGFVDISDSAFQKIETRVFQGGAGLSAGTTTVSVENATDFPATGSIYIGRGTGHTEGPLAYSAKAAIGSYWTLTLVSPIQNYHQLGESVVLAQGGDRPIVAGQLVGTPSTSAKGQVQYRTLFDAFIPDGETRITNIPIECQSPGLIGNTAEGTINTFITLPFPTAVVTNTQPLFNGTPTEDDDTYRERIRLARKSRTKAIDSAIVSGLIGTRAPDESTQITAVSTSYRASEPRVIYIDDGTGYEEKDQGVALETLTSSAQGGEQFFSLQNRPVAKAYAQSMDGPFIGTPDQLVLSVLVGGVLNTHTFGLSDFRNISAITAYEVADSINSNPLLTFAVRTVNGGKGLALYRKEETQEDIQVLDTSANLWLKFTTERVFTLNLYKNDVLLTEDGQLAAVTSQSQGLWSALGTGATLNITIDGIAQNITVTNSDFATLTNYTSVHESNSLDSWATVLMAKVAGLTLTSNNGKLVFESNLGRNDRASITINSGSIATAMFSNLPVSASGQTSDYSFNRYNSQIKLATPLLAGDKLVAGSSATNGFLEAEVGSLVIPAGSTSFGGESGAELWFAVDGDAVNIPTTINIGTSLVWAVDSSPAWGNIIRINEVNNAPVWSNVAIGDYLVVTDAAVDTSRRGCFKVIAASSTVIFIERVAGTTVGTTILTDGGVTIVRSSLPLQRVYVPAGSNYTPTSLAVILNTALKGVSTAPYRTSNLRTSTNNADGNLNLVATNVAGTALLDEIGTLKDSLPSHFGSVLSGNSEIGIPSMDQNSVSVVTNTTQFTTAIDNARNFVLAKFSHPNPYTFTSWGQSNVREVRSIRNDNAGALTVSPGATKEWLANNKLFYGRGFDTTARDTLSVLLDGDNVSGRYNIEMFRRANIVSFSGVTLELEETNGSSLALGFGTGFNWRDYAVMFKARAKSHASPDTDKTILWRWWRHGPEGTSARIQYQYPSVANAGISVESQNVRDVIVRLASGAARAVPTFRPTGKLGMAITAFGSGLYTYRYVANLEVASAARVVRINYSGLSGAFSIGETVTTSSGSATVTGDISIGAGIGILLVSGVVPTISPGQVITGGTSGATATTTTAPYGYTTLTLNLPAGVTNHGIPVNETIFFTPGDANFLAGARQVNGVTANTISYIDNVATVAAAGAIGSVSLDPLGEVTVNGTSVVTNDIYSSIGTNFPSVFKKSIKVTVAAAGRSWSGQHFQGQTPNTTLQWHSLTNSQFYPLVANTAAQIATAVNALPNVPVSAAAVGTAGPGTATGIVDAASYESTELGGTNPWWTLTDGSNWIANNNTPATVNDNFVMTLRYATTANLLSNADFANEDVRLVPVTAERTAEWLGSYAVSGISARGASLETFNGQLALYTGLLGAEGSVQVSGGSANASGVAVQGSYSFADSDIVFVTTPNEGLGGQQFVWAENQTTHYKPVFGIGTSLDSIDASTGLVTLASGNAWTLISSGVDSYVSIERQGKLVCISNQAGVLGGTAFNTSGVRPGDYLKVLSPTSGPASPLNIPNTLNLGTFTVVKVGTNCVWIEAANTIEQGAMLINWEFIEHNSIMPGDKVSFGTTIWGAGNLGTRTVTSIGPTTQEFTLSTSEIALETVGSMSALGSAASQFTVLSAQPYKTLMKIVSIAPNGTNLSVRLEYNDFNQYFGESFGTNLIVANKMGFSVSPVAGLDAYRKNTGLIAEANRKVFGDESNPVDYEGIASGGAAYNIQGSLVRRVKIGLAVRPYTGIKLANVEQAIRSAVAAEVNRSQAGKPIAINRILDAARVNGVDAVSMLTPVFGPSNDRIMIQPYEKALVTDLINDITITWVGL